MKKMIGARNTIIIVLCFTIVCLGIGFILLSMEIKKEREEEPSFQVVFSDVEKTSSVKGSTVEPMGQVEISENGLRLDMKFTLSATHDEINYVAKISNQGTLPAEIVGIMESPDYKEENFQKLIAPISIKLSDVEGKIIPAGESMDLKIVVYYNPSNLPLGKKTFSYQVGLLTKSR